MPATPYTPRSRGSPSGRNGGSSTSAEQCRQTGLATITSEDATGSRYLRLDHQTHSFLFVRHLLPAISGRYFQRRLSATSPQNRLQCRTPLLYNRRGRKSVSERFFLRFFEERNRPKECDSNNKKFFPTVPHVSFFWVGKIPKIALTDGCRAWKQRWIL